MYKNTKLHVHLGQWSSNPIGLECDILQWWPKRTPQGGGSMAPHLKFVMINLVS